MKGPYHHHSIIKHLSTFVALNAFNERNMLHMWTQRTKRGILIGKYFQRYPVRSPVDVRQTLVLFPVSLSRVAIWQVDSSARAKQNVPLFHLRRPHDVGGLKCIRNLHRSLLLLLNLLRMHRGSRVLLGIWGCPSLFVFLSQVAQLEEIQENTWHTRVIISTELSSVGK